MVSTSDDELMVSYRYDASNRRVEKTWVWSGAPSGTDGITRYIYDGWRVIEERAVIGTNPAQSEEVRARYGYGLSMDEVLWMDRDVPRDGSDNYDPIQSSSDGVIESRFFVHHDLRGSAIAVSNDPLNDPKLPASASVTERYSYDAYGSTSVWWNPTWNGSGYGTAYAVSQIGLAQLYTGQRLDRETGLYYYKNRYFDDSSGRFLSRDPLGLSDGPALYQYVNSKPTVFVDPLGLKGAAVGFNSTGNMMLGTGSRTRGCWGPWACKEKEPTDAERKDIDQVVGSSQEDAPRSEKYNCHSYAFHCSKGDPSDWRNLALNQPPRYDVSPDDDLEEQGYTELIADEPNKVGDRVLYGNDSNKNGTLEPGEITHSAIVRKVDAEGNTTEVIGKWGDGAIQVHHPAQEIAEDYYGTFREYWRLP